MIVGSAERVASFGFLADGTAVEMHTLTNAYGMEVCFINLGGIIGAIKVPDRTGTFADVTPGYDFLHEYLGDPHYLGALIGRYANRIANARFSLDGVDYELNPNDGPHLLHGGDDGFHRAVWNVEPFEAEGVVGATLSHVSPDGAGGFPGTVLSTVTYSLNDENELAFTYEATTDRATPLVLTQHLYVNLGGHDSGDVLDHELMIAASRYLPVDSDLLPSGESASVQGTPFDFRTPRRIGTALRAGNDALALEEGFDHNYVLDGALVGARLYDPHSGRTMEVETTEPGLQLYSGNQIRPGTHGKDGTSYGPHAAVALETQHFPDSPNQQSYPSTILRPGERYYSRTVYRFGIHS